MARRSILAAMAIVAAVVLPASVYAATPASAPQLVSSPFTPSVALRWTPGADPLNIAQAVYRDEGVCTAPVTDGTQVATFAGNGTTQWTTPTPVADGIYCYYIRSSDLLTSVNGPGLTVIVDTHEPTASVGVSGQVAGTVTGTVQVAGTGSDPVSGVASGVLHAGAPNACASGRAIPSTWDTTTFANGVWEVCNVVTDNAGHVAIATVTVTVFNALPVTPPVVVPPVQGAPAGTVTGANVDTTAPKAPRKLVVVMPRSKIGAGKIGVTLRWAKPAADDLDRVVVVLNLKRKPRSPADGSRVYRGLGTSVALKLRADQKGYLALYAYDRAGNVSKPARRTVSLASLIPLRPLSGSVVDETPRLTWKPQIGSTYYNVQLYRNGKRVLVGWPTSPSFDVPAGKLEPGTYVWFVWPAVASGGGEPTFADQLGRAVFVVKR